MGAEQPSATSLNQRLLEAQRNLSIADTERNQAERALRELHTSLMKSSPESQEAQIAQDALDELNAGYFKLGLENNIQ